MATLKCCILAKSGLNRIPNFTTQFLAVRGMSAGFSDDRVKVLKEMLKRKKEMGPEKPTHRSEFLEWNYRAELFAFANRIGEKFSEDSLERALTQRSHVIFEEERQKELGIKDPKGLLVDNHELAEKGSSLMEDFIPRYLRTALPKFPEEGIRALCNHLLSEQNLARIIPSIGAEELILCTDFPVEKKTLASTLCSLVGAVEESSGFERAALFVRDFVISTLSGQELNSIWSPENPFQLLSEILIRDGRSEPEPRIITQSGINTILACYKVGIYCDKKHIGTGHGETIEIALEQASLDSLWRLWEITDGKTQFPFRLNIERVLKNSNVNLSVTNWSKAEAELKSSKAG